MNLEQALGTFRNFSKHPVTVAIVAQLDELHLMALVIGMVLPTWGGAIVLASVLAVRTYIQIFVPEPVE